MSSFPEEPPSPVEEVATPAPTGLGKLVDLLAATQRRNDMLNEQIFKLSGQLGFYQAKIQEYEQKILQLEAPREESPLEAVPLTQPPTAAPEPVPWWKRLFGSIDG